MIIFTNWFGRLGNNIIQLSNIIDIALEYKHNIIFHSRQHYLFDISIIKKYFDKYSNTERVVDMNNFFYKDKLPFSSEVFIKHSKQRNAILRNAFLIHNIQKLPENDLVVHIRSGDVFSSCPHPKYIPPPLSYYIKEINKRNYNKIYIICEDTINPVVNQLLKLYKNAVYRKNNLETDIRIILGASNIIRSIGTFVESLMIFSDNIKFIHNSFNESRGSQEYYKIMSPWKNTINQRKYILTYNY